jgi:hypothetical protein
MNSSIFTLNSSDFIKGLITAVLTSVVTIIYQTISTGSLTFDWKAVATVALTSALGYIMKNLLTNSAGKFLAAE